MKKRKESQNQILVSKSTEISISSWSTTATTAAQL